MLWDKNPLELRGKGSRFRKAMNHLEQGMTA
jgi:hypothetical protein